MVIREIRVRSDAMRYDAMRDFTPRHSRGKTDPASPNGHARKSSTLDLRLGESFIITSILFPIVYSMPRLFNRVNTSRRDRLCLLHVDSLSVSRTPVGYRARNRRGMRERERKVRKRTMRERTYTIAAGEPMPVAVGEPYGIVWEGVGSARGRPQAGRASESRREIVRVVCHEAEIKRGTWREEKETSDDTGREREEENEKGR